MDLTLAQLLYKHLGWVGVVFIVIYICVTFIGSLVDGIQMAWLFRRHRKRRERVRMREVEKEVLAELYRSGRLNGPRDPDRPGSNS